MHFAFAKNLRTDGSRYKITEKWSVDARSRTREEAINEAQKLLKQSRGREVCYSRSNRPRKLSDFVSYQDFQTRSSLVHCFVSIAVPGKDWDGHTSGMYGTQQTSSSSQYYNISPMLMSVMRYSISGCLQLWIRNYK